MPNERQERLIERLLSEAEEAVALADWDVVAARCDSVLALQLDHADARALRDGADRAIAGRRTRPQLGSLTGEAPRRRLPARGRPTGRRNPIRNAEVGVVEDAGADDWDAEEDLVGRALPFRLTWTLVSGAAALGLFAVIVMLITSGSSTTSGASSQGTPVAGTSTPIRNAAVVSETPAASVRKASIPGLTAVDVTGNLKNIGFQCTGITATAVQGSFNWTCKRSSADGALQHDVLITGGGPTQIALVNATIFQFGATASDAVAAQFLGYIATTPYEGAQPARAKAWAEANVTGGVTTISGVKFELVRAETSRAHFLKLYVE